MAQRFVELTDVESNRSVWIDADCIVSMRETLHGSHLEATAVTFKVGNMREVVVVRQVPTTILYMLGMSVQTPTKAKGAPSGTIAIVGGPAAQQWLRDNATLVGNRWHRNTDGARCIVGNDEKRFVGLVFDEVLPQEDADHNVVAHALSRRKVVTP